MGMASKPLQILDPASSFLQWSYSERNMGFVRVQLARGFVLYKRPMNVQFKKITYSGLNARQQENYNFQKVSAVLADYGFSTLRLSDDWQGADFIAIHINGNDFLKVQLKGRLTFDKKYFGKDIWVCFSYKSDWFLYPHDELLEALTERMKFTETKSWRDHGAYSWNSLSRTQLSVLSEYKI